MMMVLHKGCACAMSEVSHKCFIYVNIFLSLCLFILRCESGMCSLSLYKCCLFVNLLGCVFLGVSYIVHSCKQWVCLLVGGR
jgi:hypothetical protein